MMPRGILIRNEVSIVAGLLSRERDEINVRWEREEERERERGREKKREIEGDGEARCRVIRGAI